MWLADHLDGKDPTQAATWTEATEANRGLTPEERIGFVVPFPLERGRKFSRRIPFVPSDIF